MDLVLIRPSTYHPNVGEDVMIIADEFYVHAKFMGMEMSKKFHVQFRFQSVNTKEIYLLDNLACVAPYTATLEFFN